jgi:hypothetical protein
LMLPTTRTRGGMDSLLGGRNPRKVPVSARIGRQPAEMHRQRVRPSLW